VQEIRDNSFFIRKFTNYLHFEKGLEKGNQVREKAKQILNLLRDKD